MIVKQIASCLILSTVFFTCNAFAGTDKIKEEVPDKIQYENNTYNDQNDNIKQSNNIIKEIFNSGNGKKLEDITIFDVIDGEKVSPELKNKILELMDQYQYDLDSYRSVISNRYKQAELKIVDIQKDINNLGNFKDEMEQNLSLAKWMIISLSVGIICLTSIVISMWKNIMNVNKNDIEVIFSLEKIKKDIKSINKRLKTLEGLNNIDTNEISDDNDTEPIQQL